MPERPRPDIEHTREALREHDERVADEEKQVDAPAEDDSAEDEDED